MTLIILIFAFEIIILAMLIHEAKKYEDLYRSIASGIGQLDISVYSINRTLTKMEAQKGGSIDGKT